MISKRRFLQVLVHPRLIFALRLALGAVFILAAAGKLPERAEFVDVVTSYGLLPVSCAHVYGSILPWLELGVGTALVLGFFSRYVSGLSLLMIISFLVANGTAIYREPDFDPCPCFGELLTVPRGSALIMDVAIMAMSVLILLHRREFLSLDGLLQRLRRRRAGPPS